MNDIDQDLKQLGQEVQKLVEENRKFLARVQDDDFDPDDDEEESGMRVEE